MVSIDVPRNAAQRIPSFPLNVRKVNETPAEFYTCPVGRKATIKGSCICTGLGAAAEVRLNADAIPTLRFIAADVTAVISKVFDIQLDAGETLSKSQDVGTNGELDLTCLVTESPA